MMNNIITCPKCGLMLMLDKAKTEAEGAKAERERIAKLLAKKGVQCCPYPAKFCNTTDSCLDCWMEYLTDTKGGIK